MRKLKLQVQMSIDGYIGGVSGELDWLTWNWDDKLKRYVDVLTDSVDTILLGRKMADGFISHWTSALERPDSEEYPFAKKMVDYPKFVFSKTLEKSSWPNTIVLNGDLTKEVMAIKDQPGKDIIVYGGASFDSSLIKAGLIDEFHLFINPVAIGKGLPIFEELEARQQFKLKHAMGFDCGIVVVNYVNE